jgi:hypothetical protein
MHPLTVENAPDGAWDDAVFAVPASVPARRGSPHRRLWASALALAAAVMLGWALRGDEAPEPVVAAPAPRAPRAQVMPPAAKPVAPKRVASVTPKAAVPSKKPRSPALSPAGRGSVGPIP